jgi:hypothetical protein
MVSISLRFSSEGENKVMESDGKGQYIIFPHHCNAVAVTGICMDFQLFLKSLKL